MKLGLVACRRLPDLPGWALLVVGGYALFFALGLGLEAWLHRGIETCIFHGVTGLPCPGCGSTRAFRCLARGDLLQALRFNPLVSTLALLGLSGVLARAATGRCLRAEASPAERRALLALAALALGANWAWLLLTLR